MSLCHRLPAASIMAVLILVVRAASLSAQTTPREERADASEGQRVEKAGSTAQADSSESEGRADAADD